MIRIDYFFLRIIFTRNSSAFELDNDDSNATRIHDTIERLLPSTTNKKFNVKFGCNGFTRDRNNNERNNIDTKSKIGPIRDRAIHPLETRLERRDTEIRRYRSLIDARLDNVADNQPDNNVSGGLARLCARN